MMEELTYPVELTDEELDLVAAGCGCGCGGDTNGNGSLNILSFNTVQLQLFGNQVSDNA